MAEWEEWVVAEEAEVEVIIMQEGFQVAKVDLRSGSADQNVRLTFICLRFKTKIINFYCSNKIVVSERL